MNKLRSLLTNTDKALLILPLCFAAISLLMLESISYDGHWVLSRDIIVQSAAYILGFIGIFFIIDLDYKYFQNFDKILYVGSILFLLSVYVPGLGYTQFSARSWINLGFTTFQPSEIVKITFTILMANYLSKKKTNIKTFKGVLFAAIYAAPFILIIVKEDLGSALVFCIIWVCMIFYAGIDYKLFAKFAVVFALSLPLAYRFMAKYQKSRIDAFLHPDNLTLPGNYQVWNSKIAIGSGGFFGKGLFKGTQKELDFLPVQKSDFFFSVIAEEFGFIGGAVVIALFGTLLYRICRIVSHARDSYGALLAMGFAGMFLFQIFENIAMAMGIMPVTGITLPFLSYGGSSIISNMLSLGFIISVGKKSKQ